MRITISKNKICHYMLFWVPGIYDPRVSFAISFTKRYGDAKYSLANKPHRTSKEIEEIFEIIQQYIPNIDESLIIDGELEMILILKYGISDENNHI